MFDFINMGGLLFLKCFPIDPYNDIYHTSRTNNVAYEKEGACSTVQRVIQEILQVDFSVVRRQRKIIYPGHSVIFHKKNGKLNVSRNC